MEKISTGGVFLKNSVKLILVGSVAGAVTGLLGAGGGMLLVPLLGLVSDFEPRQIFAASVCIIIPVCVASVISTWRSGIPWDILLPYLIGSCGGGVLAGAFGKKIPTKWLHRILGIMILWGGVRYLC